jgi:alpha/beta hydrolase fold
MKKLVTTVAAAGMLAAGLAAWPGAAAADTTAPGATSARAAEYSPPPIAWGQCASTSLQQAGAQCGLLTVPLDYAKPLGTKIKALGADKINYYGFSYGTYLGQVYSTLYPDRVRRMVWDGIVNPVDV